MCLFARPPAWNRSADLKLAPGRSFVHHGSQIIAARGRLRQSSRAQRRFPARLNCACTTKMLTSDDKPQRTQSFRTKRFLRLLLREAIDMPGTRLIESLPLLLRSISHRPEPPKIPFFTYSVFSVPSVVKKTRSTHTRRQDQLMSGIPRAAHGFGGGCAETALRHGSAVSRVERVPFVGR